VQNANWSTSITTALFCIVVSASHLLRGLLEHFSIFTNQIGNLESLEATHSTDEEQGQQT